MILSTQALPSRSITGSFELPDRLSDVSIVQAFREGHANAQARLFDRYGEYIERLLLRVMGSDPEIEDLLHEAFIQSFRSIHSLRDAQLLKPWLTRLTVNIARSCIRKRGRSRWLIFLPHEEVPEMTTTEQTSETKALLARVYVAVGAIRNADERIAFTLRHIDGMTLPETADACGCSLATIKRRVAKGHKAFIKVAERDTELAQRFELGGSR